MIDLSGVARQLRLSVDQIRIAGDLIEQGYPPAFIERYRADETGCLSRSALWAIKLEVDRQQRLEVARQKAISQLPKDAELDEEGRQFLASARTEVDVEAVLRAYRARRNLEQSQERDSQAGKLLEALIAYDGPPVQDLNAWVAKQMSIEAEAVESLLAQASRLVGNLMQCDSGLSDRLRKALQRNATLRVEFIENKNEDDTAGGNESAEVSSDAADSESVDSDSADQDSIGNAEADGSEQVALVEEGESESEATESEATGAEDPASSAVEPDSEVVTAGPGTAGAEQSAAASQDAAAAGSESVEGEANTVESLPSAPEGFKGKKAKLSKAAKAEAKKQAQKAAKKALGKMTPRQRRRRWLIAMLQPMRGLKRQLTKLTAYQQLMLGRGRRSQLVTTNLDYDIRALANIARDTFVNDKHPLAHWFRDAATATLEHSLKSRIESDAVAELEELAQERLLESATDQLRSHLMRRPARGHTVMLVDTVGPKTSAIVIVDPTGKVLVTDELPCSAQPSIVSQNVIKLGELIHKHRVTLVALTNGPARRFLVLTIRELMQQSADSGLRWTMADRSGAEAYAASRSALKQLSVYNRRDRAAIWIARSLQDPLGELLKVDIGRLRLGSYQRELPQEPLKKLVEETIADCLVGRGIDTHHATAQELGLVPGVGQSQAKQIAQLAREGKLESRSQLLTAVENWPEKDSRQALAWLRVYGSEEPLDATAIHPDDYRLAKRLIDGTELNMPPAAPEGWVRPEPVTAESDTAAEATSSEMALAGATNSTDADSGEHTSPQDIALQENALQDNAEVEAAGDASPDSVSTSNAEAAEQIHAEPVETTSTESEPTAAEAEVAESAPEEGVKDAATEPVAESAEPAAGESVAPTSAFTPEYSEDVAIVEASRPEIDVEKLARGWQVGREKLRWIAGCLHEPFADNRLKNTPIPMLKGMPTLETLEPGQCVWAVVVGVADFGAFVELGPDCSGLVHISRLSSSYVEDPHQCVQVGDLLMTWVVSVDSTKNRVALTALTPEERAAAEAQLAQRRDERQQGNRGGYRQREDGGGAGQGRGGHGQARGDQSRGGQSRGGQQVAANQSQGGHGNQGQGDSRGGDRGRGQPRVGGGRGPGGRGDGGRGGGRGQGGRGRQQGGRHGERVPKTVVVTSKKPKAVISEAMKEGDEPLRSFSDLMQFYETKRTDEAPATIQVKESVKSESNADSSSSSNTVETPASVEVQEASSEVQEIQNVENNEN